MLPVAEPWPARTAQKSAPHSSLRSPSAGLPLGEGERTASLAPVHSSSPVLLPRRPDRRAQAHGTTARGYTPHRRALHDGTPGFPVGTARQVRRCSAHGLQSENLQKEEMISQENRSVVLLRGPRASLLYHASYFFSLCSIHCFLLPFIAPHPALSIACQICTV